jgi:hypothetical protein
VRIKIYLNHIEDTWIGEIRQTSQSSPSATTARWRRRQSIRMCTQTVQHRPRSCQTGWFILILQQPRFHRSISNTPCHHHPFQVRISSTNTTHSRSETSRTLFTLLQARHTHHTTHTPPPHLPTLPTPGQSRSETRTPAPKAGRRHHRTHKQGSSVHHSKNHKRWLTCEHGSSPKPASCTPTFPPATRDMAPSAPAPSSKPSTSPSPPDRANAFLLGGTTALRVRWRVR